MLSERTFKSLFNNSVDSIVLVDVEKERIISANKVFCQKTGYNEAEVKNLAFKDLHREEELSLAIEYFRTSAAGRHSIARELPFRNKNGSIFYADVTSIDIHYDGKKYLMGIFRDVTSQKRIKDELVLKSVILQTQLEMSPDGILILDDKGNIILSNKRAYDMWNMPQRLRDSYNYEEGAQHIMGMLKEPEKYTGILRDFYKNQEEEQRLEIQLKDGRTFDRYSAPMLDSSGTYLGRIWFFRDISDYRKIEQDLKLSEDRLRLAMEVTNDALWDWNIVTNEVYRNPRHATMLGYTPEELSNSQDEWKTRIHPDDVAFVMDVLNRHLRGEISFFELEYRLRKKSGEYIWVLGRGKVIEYDNRNMPLRMVGTNIDITEHKKMEAELAAERNKLRSIMKVINQAVTIFDLDYTVVYLNDYARKFNAVREGEKCFQVFAGQDKICDECLVEMVYKDGSSHSSTKLLTLPSGEKIWWENTASPIRDDTGKMIYCLEVGKDVTERMKAHEEIRQSEERFRSIVENAGLGTVIFDENGKILYINRIGAESFDYSSPEPLIGKTLWDFYPAEIAERNVKLIRQVIKTGQVMIDRSTTVKELKKYWYDVLIHPFSFGKDKVKSVLVIGREVTEIKLAQEKLEKYREQMAHAEQLASLGTLSAQAAHELAQPLTVISFAIENALSELKQTRSTNIVEQKLEICKRSVTHITSVINKFRNFARKSSKTSFGETDFMAIAQMNVSLFKEIAERAKVTLTMEGMDTLPHILANDRDMHQLFFCLIENAIQAADQKEERRLVIRGSLKDDYIELRFCDNCGGIAPEHLDKIFEPFFTTKPIDQGTGLGLCIAQDIVSRAGGKIDVENKWPEGSTFHVTLPLNNV